MLDDLFVDGDVFTSSYDSKTIQSEFKSIYENLGDDPYTRDKIRARAYARYTFNENSGLRKEHNRTYFQTYESNNVDGGYKREFIDIPENLINHAFFKELINKDIFLLKKITGANEFTIGIHPIRYIANEDSPSYSSPSWLHKDDEELVFLHFLFKSENAIGGDSVISENGKKINCVKSLERFMDTIILTRDFLHAVTPIGSRGGVAYRDILLVTVESKVQKQ